MGPTPRGYSGQNWESVGCRADPSKSCRLCGKTVRSRTAKMCLGCDRLFPFAQRRRCWLDLGSGGIGCLSRQGWEKRQGRGVDDAGDGGKSPKNAEEAVLPMCSSSWVVEALPLAITIDTIISNCVLNLVPDKAKAFEEAAGAPPGGGSVCGHRYMGRTSPGFVLCQGLHRLPFGGDSQRGLSL